MFRNGLKKKRVKSKCGSTNAINYNQYKVFSVIQTSTTAANIHVYSGFGIMPFK